LTKSRFDISNAAISIFLHDVAKYYDQARGFAAFEPTPPQATEVLQHFSSQCCYCGVPVCPDDVVWDYLIPVDKGFLGLHAWGNVIPSCQPCNTARQQKPWREFLNTRSARSDCGAREALIESFVAAKRYDLHVNLRAFADNLYEDIGAVAMTLIQLRCKQAEQKIRAILSERPVQRSSTDRRARKSSEEKH
jgi:hypothetical protein